MFPYVSLNAPINASYLSPLNPKPKIHGLLCSYLEVSDLCRKASRRRPEAGHPEGILGLRVCGFGGFFRFSCCVIFTCKIPSLPHPAHMDEFCMGGETSTLEAVGNLFCRGREVRLL